MLSAGRRAAAWLFWPIALVALGLVVEARGLFPALRFAINRNPYDMPSTRAVPDRDRTAGYPLVSVVADPRDLWNEDTGLIANPTGRGRDWERFAYASFFDKGGLVFATGAGLRIHGGRSRVGSEKKSFGLFFRRRYGDAGIPSQLLFSPPHASLPRVVLHNDVRFDRTGRRWQFVNPLAYDIATRIGSITPRTRPLRFLLNGERQGVYVLTEHIDEAFFEARFGHSDFHFEPSESSTRLRSWARDTQPFDAVVANRVVDLDNLTSWVVTILFCGTTDIWQGTLARDRRSPEARWFWVTWDLDHSFMDLYQRAPVPWEIDTFDSLLGAPDARSRILGRLLDSDPQYRERFIRTVARVLNHVLTPAFLQERLTHYRIVAGMYDIQPRDFLDRIEEFFARRPAVVRRLMRQYAGAGEPIPVRVAIPDGAALEIDGHRTTGAYDGTYFAGTPIMVTVPAELRQQFAGWSVNGADLDDGGPALTIPVTTTLRIEPRFSGARPTAGR
jgi:hypothetical protein